MIFEKITPEYISNNGKAHTVIVIVNLIIISFYSVQPKVEELAHATPVVR